MKEEKRQLRRERKERRIAMGYQLQEKAIHIKHHLQQSRIWQTHTTIACTYAMNFEIPTEPIIQLAQKEKKQVALPVIIKEGAIMNFYCIHNMKELTKNEFGIYEPNTIEKCEMNENVLLIVPGFLFSKKGYRIGFGGGYFDRFLQKHHVTTVGLCLHEEFVNDVPNDSWDIPVQYVVTEKGVFTCSS